MEPKVKPRSIQLQSHILNPSCLFPINREKKDCSNNRDLIFKRGFPGNLVVKESTCNVGDTGDECFVCTPDPSATMALQPNNDVPVLSQVSRQLISSTQHQRRTLPVCVATPPESLGHLPPTPQSPASCPPSLTSPVTWNLAPKASLDAG